MKRHWGDKSLLVSEGAYGSHDSRKGSTWRESLSGVRKQREKKLRSEARSSTSSSHHRDERKE
jgi:hypothetical protein